MALATSACGASLTELDVEVVLGSGVGKYGAHVLLGWAPANDGACPSLTSDTEVSVDGVRLEAEHLGGKRWDTSDGMPALPHRRCIRQALFLKSLATPVGTPRSHVEISDGEKTIVVEVDALRAATTCRLLPPHERTLVRGARVSIECLPSGFRVSEAHAAFGPSQYDHHDAEDLERAANGFSFIVPQGWKGNGLLTLNVDFEAPVRVCKNARGCTARGRRILDQTYPVEVQ